MSCGFKQRSGWRSGIAAFEVNPTWLSALVGLTAGSVRNRAASDTVMSPHFDFHL